MGKARWITELADEERNELCFRRGEADVRMLIE
jgi:hypothetical protein